MSILKATFPGFGLGLLNRLWNLLTESTTNGASNLMFLSIDNSDRLLVCSDYINDTITSVRTPAELAILRALYRLSSDPLLAVPAFDNEPDFKVFKSKVRTSIFNPNMTSSGVSTSIPLAELKDFTDQSISLAIKFLRRVRHDGCDVFSTPDLFQGCRYVSATTDNPAAELSTIDPNKKKLSIREIGPLVVSNQLMNRALTNTSELSPANKLCTKVLAVGSASKYKEYAIFTGPTPSGSATINTSLLLDKDYDESVTIVNPFFAPTEDDMYGESDAEDDEQLLITHPDTLVRQEIMPTKNREVTFDTSIELEKKLEAVYAKRIPDEYLETFAAFI